MFKRIRNMHPVTGIVIGVVATLVLSGTAMAITDTNFTYSTVQTGYLMLGPGDLVPDDATSANTYSLNPVWGYLEQFCVLLRPGSPAPGSQDDLGADVLSQRSRQQPVPEPDADEPDDRCKCRLSHARHRR